MIEQKDSEIEKKDSVIRQISIENKQKEERLYLIIRKMLEKGMNWKTIREITGFCNEEIEQIVNDIGKGKNNKEE